MMNQYIVIYLVTMALLVTWDGVLSQEECFGGFGTLELECYEQEDGGVGFSFSDGACNWVYCSCPKPGEPAEGCPVTELPCCWHPSNEEIENRQRVGLQYCCGYYEETTPVEETTVVEGTLSP